MKLTDTIAPPLELDTYHSESYLKTIGMNRLEHHNLNYFVFELMDHVYYFEQVRNEFLRLFCVTTKSSFYLS